MTLRRAGIMGFSAKTLKNRARYFLLTKVWLANIVEPSECSFTIAFFVMPAFVME